MGLVFLAMHLFHYSDLLLKSIFKVLLPLIEAGVRFDLHFLGVDHVLLGLLLLGQNGLFSRQFHFDLLPLDVVKSENLVTLVHFSLPSHELSFVPLVVLKVLQPLLLHFLGLLESKGFAFDGSGGQLHGSLHIVKVRDMPGLNSVELNLRLELFFELHFSFFKFVDGGSALGGEVEAFPGVLLVLFSNEFGFGLATSLLVFLDIDHRFLKQVLRNGVRLGLAGQGFGLRNNFGLGLRQVKRSRFGYLFSCNFTFDSAHGRLAPSSRKAGLSEGALALRVTHVAVARSRDGKV
mmetsp:Transcript_13678/g.21441  ORF Transcript_13678/g.21441 Transcript_13678/m.21441 type:complete len:292 (+) Transcript_13678:866-1741(+)